MNIVSIDGESIAPFGYCLMCSSAPHRIRERRRLSSSECFEFLLSEGKGADRLFGFGIGYDVCHWIADLTDKEKALLATKGRCYTLQGGRFYRLTYHPGAYFEIDRLEGFPLGKEKARVEQRAVIVDIMRWHRKPLVDVAFDWDCITTETADWLRAMKANRAQFGAGTTKEAWDVEEYCEEECTVTTALVEQMVSDAGASGIPISHPFRRGVWHRLLRPVTTFVTSASHLLPTWSRF